MTISNRTFKSKCYNFRKMSDLSVDELKTLASIYELVCYLIHIDYDFVTQLCDSVYIIANDLLRHLLSDGNEKCSIFNKNKFIKFLFDMNLKLT